MTLGDPHEEASRRPGPWWLGPLWVSALCLGAAMNAWRYRHFYSDDALISLRYADRWLRGEGLTWTHGEWVEGYSNLGWIVLTSALGLLGMDLVLATRILGHAGLFGVIALLSLGEDDRLDPRRALSGGIFGACCLGLGVWAMGGLAQTFVSCLGVGGLLAARRVRDRDTRASLWVLLAVLGVATVTRIDGFVLAGAILLGATAAGLPARKAAVSSMGVVVVWAAQQLFRMAYYGDWVANTARVKVSFTMNRAWHGVGWVGQALFDHAWLVGFTLIATVVLRQRRYLDAFIAGLVWCAFVSYVGGDIFMGWRLVLPAFPMFALLVSDLGARVPRSVLPVIALCAGLQGYRNFELDPVTTIPANPKHWVLRVEPVAEVLVEAFAQHDPLLAVDAAGALPYFTRFRAVDALGLTDRYLATHPPEHWGGKGIGHDLGDGDYIFDRKPDILAFQSGLGGMPSFLAGRQLMLRRDWSFFYRSVFVAAGPEGDRVVGHYFFRSRDSGLAILRSKERIEAPGYFFTRLVNPAVWKNGILGPELPTTGLPLRLRAPQGRWRAQAIGDGPVRVEPAVFDHPGGYLEGRLVPATEGIQLEAVVLVRVPDAAPAPGP